MALSRLDKTSVFFAPDVDQHHAVNHLSGAAGEGEGEQRNCRVEAARIARGKVEPLEVRAPLSIMQEKQNEYFVKIWILL